MGISIEIWRRRAAIFLDFVTWEKCGRGLQDATDAVELVGVGLGGFDPDTHIGQAVDSDLARGVDDAAFAHV